MDSILRAFDQKYAALHEAALNIVANVESEKLFLKPPKMVGTFSFAENLLRSAGKVEQTFGGITTRLWDDPFEWALPEELSTKKKIVEYLEEVETTRKRGFAFFSSDDDLSKEIPAPQKMMTICELLLSTLIEASVMQDRAAGMLKSVQNYAIDFDHD